MKVPLARKTLVNEPDKNGETTAVVYELTKRTQEVLFRFGTIIQSIFSAQSEVNICLTVWKWSGESQYPGVLLPLLEFFRCAFSPHLTDCPWVSKYGMVHTRQCNHFLRTFQGPHLICNDHLHKCNFTDGTKMHIPCSPLVTGL